MYDVVIIGAGITGSFLAHELSRYQLQTLVIEKNSDVANGATMANSAIIHSGHDPKPGTLKAKLNVRGNELYEGICRELGVQFKRTSALVVATSEEEKCTLDQLYQQSLDRKVPVEYLTREEAIQKEPNLSDQVQYALELPSTGIIYPWEVAIALMEESVMNGVELRLGERVTAIRRIKEHEMLKKVEDNRQESESYQQKTENCHRTQYEIQTDKGRYCTRFVINAAGVYADEIYQMIAREQNREKFHISPRKGEYFVLDKLKEPLVSHVIYPVPSEAGKGVLVVPTTHGNLLLGPDSDVIQDKEGNYNTSDALNYVKKEISKTVKNVPMDKIIRTFAGLRPTGDTGDFVIEEAEDAPQFINVACIESPGLASAPAIAEYVMEQILRGKISFIEKKSYEKRKPILDPKKITIEERQKLVKENPKYGKIVCRCEQVTEGEILDAIHRPVGATTVKGVKKRVRPGMGRCQGGFCEPLVVDILARELGNSPLEVRLDGADSVMLTDTTKGGEV